MQTTLIKKTREQIPTWVIFCNAEGKILDEDERAIKRCFEAVPGDPLDNMKGWRSELPLS